MGRPRKDRISEHAGHFAEELRRLLGSDFSAAVQELRATHQKELAALRKTVASLERRVDALMERDRRSRSKLGRWVPGGPGRPPKDAAARIAAFKAKAKARR